MTDWQIAHLLCDPDESGTGETMPYEDLFWYSYRIRGYTDADIEKIWQWYNEGVGDEVLCKRLQEPDKWLQT